MDALRAASYGFTVWLVNRGISLLNLYSRFRVQLERFMRTVNKLLSPKHSRASIARRSSVAVFEASYGPKDSGQPLTKL